MRTTYSVSLCKLVTTFLTFSISFFLVTIVNHYEVHVIFQDIEYQLREISFITSFVIVFIKSSLDWEVSLIHSDLFTGNFCDIAQPYKLFTFQYWFLIFYFYDWWFFISIIIFHIFVISFCISINCVTYSSSNAFFNH